MTDEERKVKEILMGSISRVSMGATDWEVNLLDWFDKDTYLRHEGVVLYKNDEFIIMFTYNNFKHGEEDIQIHGYLTEHGACAEVNPYISNEWYMPSEVYAVVSEMLKDLTEYSKGLNEQK